MKLASESLARVPASLYSAFRADVQSNPALPDFLKCDVEGAEVEVFRGAQRLLKEKRPGIICEMHSEENQRNLLEEFSPFGYTRKPCGTNHILARPQ